MLAFDNPASQEKMEHCTMTKIIVYLQIRRDMGSKAPDTISSSPAQLQWTARGVFMTEIIREGDANQVEGCSDYVR